jgi:DDE superfamily endonuclease
MPAKVSVPDSLSSLLHRFRTCFTAPGYEVFIAMFTGFVLRPVERTVCGMLTGAGLAGVWHHSRAHRFFANTRWDVRQVGLTLAALVVDLLLPPDAAILLAIDETLTRRRGPKVFAASWWHDGSAAGTTKIGYGNSWVVLAIVVTLPFCRRPIALPILFTLCVKGGRSKPDLGRDLLDQVAETFPTRTIHLVGDAAYGAGHFAGLGRNITLTTEPAATPCSTTPHRRPAGNAADPDSAANASAPPPTSPPRPTRTTPGSTP